MIAKPKIIVIVGPTASGKSDLAVALAKQLNGEVISADSRQVYRGLDIGTGKITKREMHGIPHHLLDVASPQQHFNAADFVALTKPTISKIISQGKVPIICGGTGFYVDALLGTKPIPEVPPNTTLRKKLEKKSVEKLFEILKKFDPERAKNIDAKNPRRLIRAIEICETLGKVPKITKTVLEYEVLKVGLTLITPSPTPSSYSKRKEFPEPSLVVRDGRESYFLDTQKLKTQINKRIEKWFKKGLIKEVEDLHKKGLSWKRMSEIGLEYRLVAEFLQNKISRDELRELMQRETWQYAKRQMTWFKKDKEIIWLEPKISQVKTLAQKFLRA